MKKVTIKAYGNKMKNIDINDHIVRAIETQN